jgi:hypothetical protein
MTDEEWVFLGPFLTGESAKGGRPLSYRRRVLDGISWTARPRPGQRPVHADRFMVLIGMVRKNAIVIVSGLATVRVRRQAVGEAIMAPMSCFLVSNG